MMTRLYLHILLSVTLGCLLLRSSTITQAQDAAFSGRIVDGRGQPVADANLYLHAVAPPNTESNQATAVDYNVLHYRADKEGRFQFLLEAGRFALCATYPTEEEFFTPLLPSFMCGRFDHKTFQVSANETSFLGDVNVSFTYQRLELTLLDDRHHLLRPQHNALNHLWLKLSDEQYYHLTTVKVPLNALAPNQAKVRLSLPEGVWRIEISTDENPKIWSRSSPLIISKDHRPYALMQILDIRFPTQSAALTLTAAKTKLRRMNIEYSLASFIERAYDGNVEIVKLFIESGFDVNTLSQNNSTVLMAGVGFPKITELLLTAKADVQQKTDEGDTALMFAVIASSIESVNLLLQAGALVNEQNNEGKTPLMFAVEENEVEITKLLLKNGAKKDTKTMGGRTVLDIAKQLERTEIIKLLSAY